MENGIISILKRYFFPQLAEVERSISAKEAPETASAPDKRSEFDRDIDLISRTAWGEARGEGREGLAAVMHVIRNRKKRAGEDTSYEEVVKKPKQFSVWLRSDPNYRKMQELGQEDLMDISKIARDVLSGTIEDPTGGATHYHSTSIEPRWASSLEPTGTIGRHAFYRER